MAIAGQKQLIPGILGGLGPLAHIEFERRLIAKNVARGACKDQDHPVWILVGANNIPDRTQSLAGHVPNCIPWLVRYGQLLERAGADFLIITCNTAHAFYSQVQPQLKTPWLHLMHCTSHLIANQYNVKQVGILATDGTLQTGLYSRSLMNVGLIPICPAIASPIQQQVMQSIYHADWGIKATGIQVSDAALANLKQAVDWLQRQGAELVISGCTELSVALPQIADLSLPWIDPLDVAADLTLNLCWGDRILPSISEAYLSRTSAESSTFCLPPLPFLQSLKCLEVPKNWRI
jgi:aspartate racemase